MPPFDVSDTLLSCRCLSPNCGLRYNSDIVMSVTPAEEGRPAPGAETVQLMINSSNCSHSQSCCFPLVNCTGHSRMIVSHLYSSSPCCNNNIVMRGITHASYHYCIHQASLIPRIVSLLLFIGIP